MTRAWWIAAGIVAAANAAVVGGAAWNRNGEPAAVLELSERELELPPATAENTALALRLRWTDSTSGPPPAPSGSESAPQASSPAEQPSRPEPGGRVAPWFDRAKLEEVGFDCRLPLDEAHEARYRATPPRRVYAVLEHDGEAWRSYERSIVAAGGDASRMSRLVVVDAGLDPTALRARWPDRRRTIVAPATAVLAVERLEGRLRSLRGRITNVLPDQLNVPRPLNEVLAPLQSRVSDGPARGRYRVKVVWGRRDPWILAVAAGE